MKTIYSIVGLSLVTLMLVSCNNNSSTGKQEKSERTLEVFTNDVNAAKQQFFLRLVDEQQTDSSVIYNAKSVFEDDTVGLKVEILKDIQAGVTSDGKIDESNGFVKGSIKLSSIGVYSDNLVKALGTIFKLPSTGKMTNQTIDPLVFSSNRESVDLAKQSTYSFKLFLDNSVGTEAELFAVLDTYRKSFEMSEKDSTFRTHIISAFEGQ
ncbi:hypothetical protein [Sphingobacterium pedocola]|uniref:DUF5105 domain-containing protein n=1 Tax=Sphingobacterium pedocola TaxID=2082722 RepID=A0ABR9T6J6_9SPHI|nr:hypothetical protein [Sphingobacterium pedocola]MBE8720977.1 hypothetical protein [Sphingobacterium pedocola]